MQHPTEDGSEHERLREVPRVGIHLTHMALIIWRSNICKYMLFLWGTFCAFLGIFVFGSGG